MIRTERGPLLGNWRASAYGAARPAHLFPGRTDDRARPVCGRGVAYHRTAAVRSRPLRELCYDCLAHAAAGR